MGQLIAIHKTTKRHYTEDEFVESDLDIDGNEDDYPNHVGEAYLICTDNNGWLAIYNLEPPMADDQIADVKFNDDTIRERCGMGWVDWRQVKAYRPIISSEERQMTIDTTIDQYRQTKEAMQSIIDRHMSAAFAEIKQEFCATPVAVQLDIRQVQTMGEKYPKGAYAGCAVGLGGE